MMKPEVALLQAYPAAQPRKSVDGIQVVAALLVPLFSVLTWALGLGALACLAVAGIATLFAAGVIALRIRQIPQAGVAVSIFSDAIVLQPQGTESYRVAFIDLRSARWDTAGACVCAMTRTGQRVIISARETEGAGEQLATLIDREIRIQSSSYHSSRPPASGLRAVVSERPIPLDKKHTA
jgi:hypothetical protein